MRAVVLSEPGPADNLVVQERPMPPERDGWVRIRVEAFGLNRSELMTRLGLSGAAVTFFGSSVSSVRAWSTPHLPEVA